MKKLRTLTPLSKLGGANSDNAVIKNSMVTREQYDALQADFDSLYKSANDNYSWRRAREASIRRTLKLRTRWIIALAIVSAAQTIAIFATAI